MKTHRASLSWRVRHVQRALRIHVKSGQFCRPSGGGLSRDLESPEAAQDEYIAQMVGGELLLVEGERIKNPYELQSR